MNDADSMYEQARQRQRELLAERDRARVAETVRTKHSYSGRLAGYLRRAADAIDPDGRSRSR